MGREARKGSLPCAQNPDMHPMSQNDLRLRSRVWNATLVDEFSRDSSVQLDVRARVLMDPDSQRHQNQNDDVTVVSLVGFSNNSAAGGLEDIPLWMILIAVAIGLFLVILIVVILYKFGFFKRLRHYNDLTISAKVTNAASGKRDEYIS